MSVQQHSQSKIQELETKISLLSKQLETISKSQENHKKDHNELLTVVRHLAKCENRIASVERRLQGLEGVRQEEVVAVRKQRLAPALAPLRIGETQVSDFQTEIKNERQEEEEALKRLRGYPPNVDVPEMQSSDSKNSVPVDELPHSTLAKALKVGGGVVPGPRKALRIGKTKARRAIGKSRENVSRQNTATTKSGKKVTTKKRRDQRFSSASSTQDIRHRFLLSPTFYKNHRQDLPNDDSGGGEEGETNEPIVIPSLYSEQLAAVAEDCAKVVRRNAHLEARLRGERFDSLRREAVLKQHSGRLRAENAELRRRLAQALQHLRAGSSQETLEEEDRALAQVLWGEGFQEGEKRHSIRMPISAQGEGVLSAFEAAEEAAPSKETIHHEQSSHSHLSSSSTPSSSSSSSPCPSGYFPSTNMDQMFVRLRRQKYESARRDREIRAQHQNIDQNQGAESEDWKRANALERTATILGLRDTLERKEQEGENKSEMDEEVVDTGENNGSYLDQSSSQEYLEGEDYHVYGDFAAATQRNREMRLRFAQRQNE